MPESGPWEWGLLHQSPTVRQDLGIYRDGAKPLTTEKKGRRETQIPEYLGINSNYDFGLIWVCTEKLEFLDFVKFGGVAFSVEFVVVKYLRPTQIATWLKNMCAMSRVQLSSVHPNPLIIFLIMNQFSQVQGNTQEFVVANYPRFYRNSKGDSVSTMCPCHWMAKPIHPWDSLKFSPHIKSSTHS